MDVRRITEVGIAVQSLDQAVAMFTELFNADVGPVIDVPLYDMRFRMCRVGKVDFEVMEPTAPKGVIHDFLVKRGEGLHHIASPSTTSTTRWARSGPRACGSSPTRR